MLKPIDWKVEEMEPRRRALPIEPPDVVLHQ
jgi:hypothetical protein